MSRIVVGVDGSPQSRDAVMAGGRLAALQGDQLVMVHARSGQLESLLGEGQHETLVRSVVEEALAAATAAGVRSPQMELIGDEPPAPALQRLAERDHTRAIVVGSSHRGPIGRVVPGGVAQRLLSGAPCPVVVAPVGYAERDAAPLETVGCGFDGSDGARAAWRVACDLATSPTTVVQAIAVYQHLAFGYIPASMATGWQTVNDELRQQLRRDLDELVASAPAGVRAEPIFDEGNAALVLTKASERLDLLVLGSRGYGPVRSVLVGSVAAQLIVAAACPVMVVPRPAD